MPATMPSKNRAERETAVPSADAHVAAAYDRRVELDIVGTIEGADKASAIAYSWDYLKHYEALFAPFREQPINLIEVGIKGGISLRMWKHYFPKAHIVGIDIKPKCASLAEERVTIQIGSQVDARFLSKICTDTPPTIFIDDGSHLAQHNIFTFEHVFPMLVPGGLYVVEDLAFHLSPSAPRWQGDEKRNAPEYFLDLARSRLARFVVSGQEQVHPRLFGMIDSVVFIDSAVIIRKSYQGRDVDAAIAMGQRYIADKELGADAQRNLATYILKHGGNFAVAEAAIRASLQAGGPTIRVLATLAETLLKQNRHSEAVAPLQQAAGMIVGVRDEYLDDLKHLSRIQTLAGQHAAALKTFEVVAARAPRGGAAHMILAKLRQAAAGSAS